MVLYRNPEVKMKRFVTVLLIVILFSAMPLLAKDSGTVVSVGHDLTFPLLGKFGEVIRGDLVASFGQIGAIDGGVGFYNYDSARIPFYTYDKDTGINKVDLSKDFDLYVSTITGLDVVIPIGSKLDVIVGLGAWAEVDYMSSVSNIFVYVGPAARADLVFNVSKSFFLDFGVEAQYKLYQMFYDLDSKEYDADPVKDFNYPSCGLRAGIKF